MILSHIVYVISGMTLIYIPKLGHTKGSKLIQIIAKSDNFKVRKYIIQSPFPKHGNSIQQQVGA